MRTTKALAGVALALSGLLALTACGDVTAMSDVGASTPAGNRLSDASAVDILKAANDAALSQSSVHMVGTVTQGADKLTMDLRLEKDGGAMGTLDLAGAMLQVVSTGTAVYIKGDKAFWTSEAGAGAATLIGDKWVAATTGSDLAQFKDLTDFTAALGGVLDPTGTVTKGGTATIDGVGVVGVKDGKIGTLWVATEGVPLPVLIDGGTQGRVTFTEWGEQVVVSVPDPADVLDPATIGN
jgi:hypothetical protein